MHFFVWNFLYCDLNFTEVYAKVPINNKSMLVQIMAQSPTGGKPRHQIDAKSSTTTKLKKSAKRMPLLAPLEPNFISNELWKCDDSCYYIPRIRRIGGCYGFTSKPPAACRPPPAARNGVNAITQKPRDGLFSNLVYTLVVIVSWPD